MKFETVKQGEFPIGTSLTQYVHSSYVDNSFVGFKPHLLDAGSCLIPVGRTITKQQWDNQQKEKKRASRLR